MAETLPVVAADWALFLDVDGTLLEYVPRPEDVQVLDMQRQMLAALSSLLGGAVAVITGRSIADIDRIFAPLRLPVAGQHGAEARLNGAVKTFAPPSTALAEIIARAQPFAARVPAIRIENKGMSAAFHYRGAEDERDALGELLARAVVETGTDFQLYASHLCYDIKPRAANKGFALDWFMTAPPFAGRVPVFIGDDRTDEDGFVAAIARGGRAIKIGREGESLAPWRMTGPEMLWRWLARSLVSLEHGR